MRKLHNYWPKERQMYLGRYAHFSLIRIVNTEVTLQWTFSVFCGSFLDCFLQIKCASLNLEVSPDVSPGLVSNSGSENRVVFFVGFGIDCRMLGVSAVGGNMTHYANRIRFRCIWPRGEKDNLFAFAAVNGQKRQKFIKIGKG